MKKNFYRMSSLRFLWPQGQGIYLITCEGNKKSYSGQTKNFHHRWSQHLSYLRNNKHNNSYMQRAYNKYGESSFSFKVLEYVNDCTDLGARELFWTQKFQTMTYQNGFNMMPVKSEKPDVLSEMSRKRALIFELLDPQGNLVQAQNVKAFAQKHSLNPHCILNVLSGKTPQHQGWKSTNKEFHGETFTIISPEGESFSFFFLCDFLILGHLNAYELPRILNGKVLHYRGWHLPNPSQETLDSIEKYRKMYVESYHFRDTQGNLVFVENLFKFSQKTKISIYALYNLVIGKYCFSNGYTLDSSSFVVISPSGEKFVIFDMDKFAREHNLHSIKLFGVMNGILAHHRGWSSVHISKPHKEKLDFYLYKTGYLKINFKFIDIKARIFIGNDLLKFAQATANHTWAITGFYKVIKNERDSYMDYKNLP